MNKSLKTILIVLAIMIIPAAGAIGYWLYSRKKSGEDTPAKADETAKPGATPTSASITQETTKSTNTDFPLTRNDKVKSQLVKECQQAINDKIEDCIPPMCPYYNGQQIETLTVDGYYGPKTAAAVKYLFPATDGNSITENMFNQLIGKREKGSYLLF